VRFLLALYRGSIRSQAAKQPKTVPLRGNSPADRVRVGSQFKKTNKPKKR
jgi:hypothetical protein